jgi:hypothetical protein
MESNPAEEPARGSQRVASWLYEVINPLLDAARMEISFLERGNSTWRFYNSRLEHIHPIAAYLTPEGRHVFRDFQKSNPDAVSPFDQHDRLVERLEKAATEAHARLMAQSNFVDMARQALTEFMSVPSPDFPGGAFPQETFPALVGERVTNAVRELGSHYTDSKFWRHFGPQFLQFRVQSNFGELDVARDELLKSNQSLVDWLEKKSFQLCSRYDVPAAPLLASSGR